MIAAIFGAVFTFILFVLLLAILMYFLMAVWAYGWIAIKKVYMTVKGR